MRRYLLARWPTGLCDNLALMLLRSPYRVWPASRAGHPAATLIRLCETCPVLEPAPEETEDISNAVGKWIGESNQAVRAPVA